MAILVILAGRISDIDNAATPHKVMSHRDYVAHPTLFAEQQPRLINLSRVYRYRSRAYYASLLAQARGGRRVIPSVETIIDLSERRLYENAIPELEDALNGILGKDARKALPLLRLYFGIAENPRFEKFAKLLFDWFRAPSA